MILSHADLSEINETYFSNLVSRVNYENQQVRLFI